MRESTYNFLKYPTPMTHIRVSNKSLAISRGTELKFNLKEQKHRKHKLFRQKLSYTVNFRPVKVIRKSLLIQFPSSSSLSCRVARCVVKVDGGQPAIT